MQLMKINVLDTVIIIGITIKDNNKDVVSIVVVNQLLIIKAKNQNI